MKNNNVINILDKLISCKSLTPFDDNCQEYIANFLKDLGFEIEFKKYGDVTNLIARYGSQNPVLAYVGHTDVVPTGDIEKWHSDPFKLTEKDSKLYGRGTSDMKGGIACMLHSIQCLLQQNQNIVGSIVIVLTSDEEGPAVNGIKKLVESGDLSKYDIDMCIVGEPSCKKSIGDTIKNGRRGSLSGTLKIQGIQGHIAYPQNAKNPIHGFSSTLNELISQKYDKGNKYFPPTSFQISNINSGAGATNIIPGELTMDFNFRYSTETTREELQNKFEEIMEKSGLDYSVNWSHSGDPFLTKKKDLLNACLMSIKEELNMTAKISTDGGTSDGRFMAKICDQVIEFGLINESIHKINEHTTSAALDDVSKVYTSMLNKLLTK